ncbi:MAG: hypothetical protein WBZ36_24030 [Candidatus Nitrosopolaris sp.]
MTYTTYKCNNDNYKKLTKNNIKNNNDNLQRRQRFFTSLLHHHYYYFMAAAVATGIAGMVHLLMPLYFAHPMLQHFTTRALIPIFFLGSGVVQIFWMLPMIKRWGKPWYYIRIVGNIAFIILYVVTRFPGNPSNGRGGDVDMVDLTCELAQVAYIAITGLILAKERTMKVAQREQLR